MDDSGDSVTKMGLQSSRVEKLVRDVIEYKNSAKTEITESFKTYRVFWVFLVIRTEVILRRLLVTIAI